MPQGLGLNTFHCLGLGSISGRGTKIPQLHSVVRKGKKMERKKIKATQFVMLKIGEKIIYSCM